MEQNHKKAKVDDGKIPVSFFYDTNAGLSLPCFVIPEPRENEKPNYYRYDYNLKPLSSIESETRVLETSPSVYDLYYNHKIQDVQRPQLKFWFSSSSSNHPLPLVCKYNEQKKQGLIADDLTYQEWQKVWCVENPDGWFNLD